MIRAVWLGCLLFVGGCFLTGYDAHLDEMDATVVLDTEAGLSPDRDAQTSQAHDAAESPDARAHGDGAPPRVDDASTDANIDTDASGASDAGIAADDAGADMDAQIDGAVGTDPEAGTDAAAPMDAASQDTGVASGDAGDGGDAGCGVSGCPVKTYCATSGCNLQCNKVPDPGNTLDCEYDCYGPLAACSNASCSANNTCLTNCTGAATCRTTCPYASTCDILCIGYSICGADCQLGSACNFDCQTYSSCTQITCALGATCRMKCSGLSTCSYAVCGNIIQQSCPDGTMLCAPLGTSC